MKNQYLTNDELDAAIQEEDKKVVIAGKQRSDELDRLFAIRKERCSRGWENMKTNERKMNQKMDREWNKLTAKNLKFWLSEKGICVYTSAFDDIADEIGTIIWSRGPKNPTFEQEDRMDERSTAWAEKMIR
tara:strand:+ start:257 stop:649 length:393 start_codon:yes stop_codon:yes gene_type:complete